jgi:Uncharacterized protein conserved in bacteria (DUF2184)
MKMRPQILNAKGEPILLNDMEQRVATYWENHIKNALGYDIDITSLTTIVKKISEQKFFHVAPADYLPLRVGQGSWSQQLTTYRSFALGADFAEGILDTGANSTRLASADAGVDSVNAQVINWAKSIGWTIFDLQMAAKSGNWDIVSAKEKARKTNWDLGIQKIAFLGGAGVQGLLNLSGVTNNTSVITKAISSMTTTELTAFCASVLAAYRANVVYTAMPTHFIIPESDYLGLAAPTTSDFPIKSKLALLEEVFQTITQNKSFKILPLAYADAANSSGILSVQRYTLLNYDEESLRMDLPVDYTNTLANSLDNFSFQNVGYGQFTGVVPYRPLETLYFSY